jgi:tetratricopeptide (TPR) repeat protein
MNMSLHPALAQINWDNPKNLKVLPEAITRADLQSTMFGFSSALGVRCTHCHDDEDGTKAFRDIDFSSDAKPAKETARLMFRMVRDINDLYLPDARKTTDPSVSVACMTCHRNQAKPRMLDDILMDIIDTDGVEAAVSHYRQLREQFEDGFSFDFRVGALNGLGYRLMNRGKLDDAIAIFKLNIEMYPDAWNPYDSLAEAYMNKGQKEQSIALYRHSLALNPDNQNAVDKLTELQPLVFRRKN